MEEPVTVIGTALSPDDLRRKRPSQPPIELCRLTSKQSHKLPRWFRRIVGGAWYLAWADHWGKIVLEDGTELFVSEPYGLSDDAVREIVKFCDKHNLWFEISATSQHYPTRTLKILIGQKRKPGEGRVA